MGRKVYFGAKCSCQHTFPLICLLYELLEDFTCFGFFKLLHMSLASSVPSQGARYTQKASQAGLEAAPCWHGHGHRVGPPGTAPSPGRHAASWKVLREGNPRVFIANPCRVHPLGQPQPWGQRKPCQQTSTFYKVMADFLLSTLGANTPVPPSLPTPKRSLTSQDRPRELSPDTEKSTAQPPKRALGRSE